MDEYQAIPEESLLIGDTVGDAAGAQNCDMDFAAALWDQHKEVFSSFLPQYYLHTPYELQQILTD